MLTGQSPHVLPQFCMSGAERFVLLRAICKSGAQLIIPVRSTQSVRPCGPAPSELNHRRSACNDVLGKQSQYSCHGDSWPTTQPKLLWSKIAESKCVRNVGRFKISRRTERTDRKGKPVPIGKAGGATALTGTTAPASSLTYTRNTRTSAVSMTSIVLGPGRVLFHGPHGSQPWKFFSLVEILRSTIRLIAPICEFIFN